MARTNTWHFARAPLVAFRHMVAQRTGFWRSLADMMLLSLVLSLVIYPLRTFASTDWAELISLMSFVFYPYTAWRLAPGQGSWMRRIARDLAWMLLFGLGISVLSWLCMNYLDSAARMFGIRFDEVRLTILDFILSNFLVLVTIFVPTRVLLLLWSAGQKRLRWQLTFSYLLMGVITVLLLPLSLVLFIVISSLFLVSPVAAPGATAMRVAATLGPLVRTGKSPAQLDMVLDAMFDGSVRVPTDGAPLDFEAPPDEAAVSFKGIRRISLLQPDGIVLASTGELAYAPGTRLPVDQGTRFALLIEQAQNGTCAEGRPADGLLPDSATCLIPATPTTPATTVLVEALVDGRAQWGAVLARMITFILFVTGLWWIVAPGAIAVAIVVAVGIGSLLARRLTRRIEYLAAATDDIASGNLARKVEVGAPDEVGRLSADFNAMAARLHEREQALATAAARAEGLLKANRRLVADVSHELRTPLATLRGYIEALEHEHGDQLPAHDLDVIQNEVRRLTELIDDLFTLARAEAQQLPLTFEAVDAKVLVQRLVDTIAPLARRERHIEVVAALPAMLPLVYADRNRLEQVLLNLVQNALRHTPPGGIVAIEGLADGASITLTVADTGVGIPEGELSLVFERFFRGDSSRARETGGAGLGLALVQELVAAMGGHVTVESQLGRGSRFSVVLQYSGRANPQAVPLAHIRD